MSLFRPEQSSAVYNSLNQLAASSGDLNNQLTQLRRLVEGVYKDLSADSGLSFSGLFARMQYVHETLQAPSEIVAQLNRLRAKLRARSSFELVALAVKYGLIQPEDPD